MYGILWITFNETSLDFVKKELLLSEHCRHRMDESPDEPMVTTTTNRTPILAANLPSLLNRTQCSECGKHFRKGELSIIVLGTIFMFSFCLTSSILCFFRQQSASAHDTESRLSAADNQQHRHQRGYRRKESRRIVTVALCIITARTTTSTSTATIDNPITDRCRFARSETDDR